MRVDGRLSLSAGLVLAGLGLAAVPAWESLRGQTVSLSCAAGHAGTAVRAESVVFAWFGAVGLLHAVGLWGLEPLRRRFFDVLFVLCIPGVAVAALAVRHLLAPGARSPCLPCLASYGVLGALFLVAATAPPAAVARPWGFRRAARDAVVATVLGLLAGRALVVPPAPRAFRLPATKAELEVWLAGEARAPLGRASGGRVSVVTFVDYQCPFCRQALAEYEPVFERHRDGVEVAVRDFPLDSRCNPAVSGRLHPLACEAAVAVRAAAGNGVEMRRWLLERQDGMSLETIRRGLREVGSVASFDPADPELLRGVSEDVALARALGVTATPTTFVNGVRLPNGIRAEQLDAVLAVEKAALAARRVPAPTHERAPAAGAQRASPGRAGRTPSAAGGGVAGTVRKSGTLAGQVTCFDGTPVGGVSVRLERDGPGRRDHRTVAADAAGRFEVRDLPGGSYGLAVLVDGRLRAWKSPVALGAGESARVDVALLPGLSIEGRLTHGRRPVSGWARLVELEGRPLPAALDGPLGADAGSDGLFVLKEVPRASGYGVLVGATGFATRLWRADAGGAGRLDLGDVELDRGEEIRGRVYDRVTREAVRGAVLSVEAARLDQDPVEIEATSDAEGAFSIPGLPPGDLVLQVSAAGYATRRVLVAAGAPVDVGLLRGGVVEGAAVGPDGRPVAAFRVSARPLGEEPWGHRERAEDVSDPRGRFRLPDLAAGSYSIRVEAEGVGDAEIDGVRLDPGRAASLGVVRLRARGTVRGTVRDSGGAPVGGARVTAARAGRGGASWEAVSQATSDPSGEFLLRVPAGNARIAAEHPDRAPAAPQEVEVDPSREATEVTIVLSRGGRVEGWLHDRDGLPVAGASLVITTATERRLSTGPDGRFAAEHVSPGPAEVVVLRRLTSRALTGALRQPVSVEEGATTTLDLRLRGVTVRGRITRGGRALAGARVSLQGEGPLTLVLGRPGGSTVGSADAALEGVTDADGAYSLEVSEPGTYFVRIEGGDRTTLLGRRAVTIPDHAVHALDVDLPDRVLSGTVVDRETQEPIPGAAVAAVSEDGATETATRAGPDGGFVLEGVAVPGRLLVQAECYRQARLALPEDTEVPVRVELRRSRTLRGRVVDVRGEPAAGIEVAAHQAGPRRFVGGALTAADGSFEITGAGELPCTLLAAGPSETVAFSEEARAGRDVLLVLQPGGRLRILATLDGEPRAGLVPSLVSVEGQPVGPVGPAPQATDTEGVTEMVTPAGRVEVRLSGPGLSGRTTVEVPASGSVSTVVPLERVEGP